MKSTRENYLEYFMLPAPVNSFTDDPDGYTATLWSFEEAMYAFSSSDILSAYTTLSDEAKAIRGGIDDYVIMTDAWMDGSATAYHDETTRQEGVKAYSRYDLNQSAESREAIGNALIFWPQLIAALDGETSAADGANYITKMSNAGVYYAPPPVNGYGFLSTSRPFAMAVKNSFFAMSNTYATTEGSTASSRGGGTAYAIDPCPKCSTIGRAINGWHQMATFYNGIDGAGVYNPYAVGTSDYYVGDSSEGLFWDSDVRTGLTLAMVAGLIDMDTYNLLVDRQELEQNTYGSAAFTSFYIYETWYGVATTFSVSDAGWQDDLFAFSYYHPAAYAGILKYDTNALISGGFPDASTSTAAESYAYGSGEYEWIHAEHDASRSNVPYFPKVYRSSTTDSIAVRDAIFGGSGPTSVAVNVHSGATDSSMGDAPAIVIGDIYRRFQLWSDRNDSTGGYYDRIGTYSKAKGFLTNKAWVLQNTLSVWNGKLEQKVHQQITKNLDIDLMHPVGGADAPGGTSYSPSSPSTAPMTTTGGSGASSYSY